MTRAKLLSLLQENVTRPNPTSVASCLHMILSAHKNKNLEQGEAIKVRESVSRCVRI